MADPVAQDRADHRVLIRDLVLACSIGAHAHERATEQRVRINVSIDVATSASKAGDSLANVLDYEAIVLAVRRIAGKGHINLVETMAERIAEACLADPRAAVVHVRVEKLDVFPDVASVGVELIRHRADG